MKKTFIGSILLMTGMLDMIAIIIAAALSLTAMTDWSYEYPSRLWFLIFAGRPPMQNGVTYGSGGLGLGFLFICGIILVMLGLIILGVEYVNSVKLIDLNKANNNAPPAE